MHGKHVLKSWSKNQAVIALSSAEAELYAAVKASCEVLGTRSMAEDFGISLLPRAAVDASAALGIIKRRGSGKLTYTRTATLDTTRLDKRVNNILESRPQNQPS